MRKTADLILEQFQKLLNEDNNIADLEIYSYSENKSRKQYRKLHTDYIDFITSLTYESDKKLLDNYVYDGEYYVMDEEYYNSTIFANCSAFFSDIYEKDNKVVVFFVEKKEDKNEKH